MESPQQTQEKYIAALNSPYVKRFFLITNLNFPNCDLITWSPNQNEHVEQIILFLFAENFSVTADYYVKPSLD